MSPTRVQRLASKVLKSIHSLGQVECEVRLFFPTEQGQEDFCNHLDDEIDTRYAEFDGGRRHEHFLSTSDCDAEDSIDSCCATCLERAMRNRKLRHVSKASAELAASGHCNNADTFKVVIVPGLEILKFTSKDTTHGDKGFTVFLPGKIRISPDYTDTGESLRLMIQKDYLDIPQDRQCCNCYACIDSIPHVRCGKCMSWLCSTCMADRKSTRLNSSHDLASRMPSCA